MITTIKVKGMSCNHCVMSVQKALEEMEGVQSAQVDLEMGQAVVDHDRPMDPTLVKDRIERAGFELG
jgi:copper chaperone